MRKLISAVLFLSFASLSNAASYWTGVWRIVQKSETEETFFHLVIRPDASGTYAVECYSRLWNQFPVRRASFQGKEISLTVEMGSGPLILKGTGNGRTWKSKWTIFHPQVPVSGEFEAHKVFDLSYWRPFSQLGKIETQEGIFDLAGYLLENVNLSTFEAFVADWDKRFEPEVYPLVHDILYGGDYYDANARRTRLRAAYDNLVNPSFEKLAKDFKLEFGQVKADLQRKFPGLQIDPRFIASPFEQTETSVLHIHGFECDCPSKKLTSSEPVFVSVGLKPASQSYSGVQFRYFLAEQMLYSRFLRKMAQVDNMLLRLFRVGTAAYLASQLNYSQKESDHLFLSEDEIKQVKAGLLDRKKDLVLKIRKHSQANLKQYFEFRPKPGVVIGYLFARKLSDRFSPEQLFDFDIPRISSELSAYLRGLETEQGKSEK